MKAKEHSLRYMGMVSAALLILAMILGCSATGPDYETAKGSFPTLEPTKARVYFLRESSSSAGLAVAQVHVNGVKIVDLYDGGFSYVDRPAGETIIKIDQFMSSGAWKATTNLEAGKEYYYRVWPNEYTLGRKQSGALVGFLIEGLIVGLTRRGTHGTHIDHAQIFGANETTAQRALEILPTLKYSKSDP